jgi:hypothetical protein
MARPVKTLAKVAVNDANLSRVQDHFLSVLNPFMRDVTERLGVVPVYSTASRPVADATQGGAVVRVKDPGAPTTVQICVSDSLGGYEWLVIGIASR